MKDPQIGVDSIVEKANNHLKYLIYGVKWVMRDYAGFTNDTATIAPNSTAQFTIQPKTSLAIGTYSETITVTDSNGASASLTASFTVCAVHAADDTAPIKETPENTAPTNDNQALPQTSDNNFLFMTVLCLISLVSLISGLIALRNLKRVK